MGCGTPPVDFQTETAHALIQRVHFSRPGPRCPHEVLNVCTFAHLCAGRRGGLEGERCCCWRSEVYRLAEVHGPVAKLRLNYGHIVQSMFYVFLCVLCCCLRP